MTFFVMIQANDVYALRFVVRDQPSCLSLPSGSPSWNSTTKTCQVTGISLILHHFDSLVLRNGTTLLITGGNITNEGLIANYHSKIINFGTVQSLINSTMINYQGSIINNGIIVNDDNFTNNGVMTNKGSLRNDKNGVMYLYQPINNLNAGIVINDGNMGASILNNFGGTVINNGAISGAGPLNRGIFFNHGIMNSYGNGIVNDAGGIMVSTGSIINHANGFIWNNDGATFFNSGYIFNPELSVFYNFNTLNNAGTIFADTPFFFQGTRNHHSTSVLNNFGTITNPDNLWNFGTLNNYNTIKNPGTLSNCAGIVNNMGIVTGNPIVNQNMVNCPQ